MTYHYETEGPAEKRIYTTPESDNEDEFLSAMRKTGAIAYHLNEGYTAMPYDGYVAYKGLYLPYEAKYTTNKKTYSMEAWRRKQEHQFLALESAYQKGFWPFKIIFWKPEDYVYWCITTFENFLNSSVLLPKLRIIGSADELYDYLRECYGSH